MALWRAYELMEAQAGNLQAAQNVYNRSIRDSIGKNDFSEYENTSIVSIHYSVQHSLLIRLFQSLSHNMYLLLNLQVQDTEMTLSRDDILKESSQNEVEVSRWNSRSQQQSNEFK